MVEELADRHDVADRRLERRADDRCAEELTRREEAENDSEKLVREGEEGRRDVGRHAVMWARAVM